ncbi:MAG TPA: hypothetical protein PLB89_13475 [Flavobacteriales bacterium]|nr:hypothetical protein [Flavobacteriales bacterium]
MRTLALLLALLIAPVVFGKGRAFAYTMEGYAYDKHSSDLLRNTSVLIGKQLVNTDDRGWYSVRISGITCDRGDSRAEIDRCNEALYGELVIRRLFSDTSITIRTNWKDHACIDRIAFTPPCYISRRDLFVP